MFVQVDNKTWVDGSLVLHVQSHAMSGSIMRLSTGEAVKSEWPPEKVAKKMNEYYKALGKPVMEPEGMKVEISGL